MTAGARWKTGILRCPPMHAEARDVKVARLDRFAGWAVLGIAPGMLHAYVAAEVLIGLIGLGWLAR